MILLFLSILKPFFFFSSYLFPQGRGQMIVTAFKHMELNNLPEDEQILFFKQTHIHIAPRTLHRICHSVTHSSRSDLGFVYPFHQF